MFGWGARPEFRVGPCGRPESRPGHPCRRPIALPDLSHGRTTFVKAKLTPADVRRRGITKITSEDIAKAGKAGKRWKLIGCVKRKKDGSLDASVRPIALPLSDPLAAVMGPTNAITFDTDLLGKVTVVGPGAGREETGYSILTDLLAIERSTR